MKDARIWYKVVTTSIGDDLKVEQNEKQFRNPVALEARRAARSYAFSFRDVIVEAGATNGRGLVIYMVFGSNFYQIESTKENISPSQLENLAYEFGLYEGLGYDTGHEEPFIIRVPDVGVYHMIWEHGKGLWDASTK